MLPRLDWNCSGTAGTAQVAQIFVNVTATHGPEPAVGYAPYVSIKQPTSLRQEGARSQWPLSKLHDIGERSPAC